MSSSAETCRQIYARDLRNGDVITWTGSFQQYQVCSKPEPDEEISGRVSFQAHRTERYAPVVGTRLREDEICTFYYGDTRNRTFIQSGA